LQLLYWGERFGRKGSESNALSKRSASKGFLSIASAQQIPNWLSSISEVAQMSVDGSSFFVYILRCADGSLYVGHTANVEDRVRVHNSGKGAAWTACRLPVALVYKESHPSEDGAVARERQLKRWTHNKKLALIHGNTAQLKSLAKRRVF